MKRPAIDQLNSSTLALAAALICTACGVGSFDNLLDPEVCDPDQVEFTTVIDNQFFPLTPGHQVTLQGGGDLVRITVLDDTETVAGVTTRIVEEYEEENGVLVEISRNYFAQTKDGWVCYFGEEVDIYAKDGAIKRHVGEWRADAPGSKPGIFMPPALTVGDAFQQEIAPGVAEDQAKVTAIAVRTETPAGIFSDTVSMIDRNLLDGDQGKKVYARGIGVIVDGPVRLTDY